MSLWPDEGQYLIPFVSSKTRIRRGYMEGELVEIAGMVSSPAMSNHISDTLLLRKRFHCERPMASSSNSGTFNCFNIGTPYLRVGLSFAYNYDQGIDVKCERTNHQAEFLRKRKLLFI